MDNRQVCLRIYHRMVNLKQIQCTSRTQYITTQASAHCGTNSPWLFSAKPISHGTLGDVRTVIGFGGNCDRAQLVGGVQYGQLVGVIVCGTKISRVGGIGMPGISFAS